jgi:hypothetical protein
MRAAVKHLNIAMLPGLIEEAQMLGNRMEAGLETQQTYKEWLDAKSTLKKEIRTLLKQKETLKK